jgi:hypothetical protein
VPGYWRHRVIETVLNECLGLHNKPQDEVLLGHKLTGPKKKKKQKRDKVTGDWRKLHNEELNDLYSQNIIRMIKSRIMRWARHVARMGRV